MFPHGCRFRLGFAGATRWQVEAQNRWGCVVAGRRRSQEMPGQAKRNQERPGEARRSQERQERPGGQEKPKEAER